MQKTISREIRKLVGSDLIKCDDTVINQVEISLFINEQFICKIAGLPEYLEQFALGNLFYYKYFQSMDQIDSYNLDLEQLRFTLNLKQQIILSHFKRESYNHIQFVPEIIYDLMHQFNNRSKLFLQTGAVHSAALICNNQIKYFASDIGRHNAIDKVIGMGLLDRVDLKNYWLFTSGRISPDTAAKAIIAQIPMIISHSAGMHHAIEMAEENRVILIGFVRGKKLNIYNGWESINLGSME